MKVMKHKSLALAIAALLSASGMASAQSSSPVATDARGNTTAGDCTGTSVAADATNNLVFCMSGSPSTVPSGSNKSIIIGQANLGVSGASNFAFGYNITLGAGTGSVGDNQLFGHDVNVSASALTNTSGFEFGNLVIGSNITLKGYENVALGNRALNNVPDSWGAVAVGVDALNGATTSQPTFSFTATAVGFQAGLNAKAADGAVFIGNGAGSRATKATFVTAVGQSAGANASMTSSEAIGYNAGNSATLVDSSFVGTNAGFGGSLTSSVGLGKNAGNNASGNYNTYIGANAGDNVTGNQNVIIGAQTFTDAASVTYSTSIGQAARAASSSVAIGQSASASGTVSNAVGYGAMATGAYSTSVGYGTSASGANSVALGSVAASSGTSSVALGYGSNDGGAANVVSIGRANATRRIINVTAGSADTDVVNVAQLRSVSQAFGGGASFAGGTFVAPVYGIQGVNYNDVGSAFAKVNETIKYIAAGSATAFNAPSVYAGSNGLAIGSSAISNAASGLAIGNGAAVRSADPSQGGGGTAVGQAARVDGSGTAVGLGASVYRTDNALTITQATAIGDSAHVNASGGTALGANAQALVTGSVALGAGSVADQANTVSIGDSTSSGNATTRRLVNLSAGQQATDAVNVGQLNTATQALGAGASYVGGVFVAPTYNIQGGSYSNVGSALNAVDSSLTSITTAAGDTLRWNASIGGYDASRAGEPSQVRNVQAGTASTDAVNVDQLNAVAAGSVLAVQYDSVGKTTITLGGSGIGHAVAIDNLADGQIAAGSHDAINGSQLFNANLVVNNLGASMANVFGGGASYAGGIFTAPVFMVQGGSFNTVAAAFNAVDAKLTTIDQRTTVLEGTGVGGVGPQGPQGPAGSSAYQLASANGFTGSESAWLASLQGKDGKNGSNGTNGVGGDASNALVYDGSSVTVAPGQAPAQVKNVASGTSGTDAVNVAQLDQAITTAKSYSDSGDGKTLSSANTYTDQRISQLNSALDDRFHKVDQRIDRTGAMGTAMSQMAMAGAGASEGGRVAAGVGLQGSAGAVAVGFAAPIGDRTHVNFGGAFSTGTATVGAGIGFDLR